MKITKRKYFKNRMVALALFVIGYLSCLIDGDITFLVFCWVIGLTLFFSKHNWFR